MFQIYKALNAYSIKMGGPMGSKMKKKLFRPPWKCNLCLALTLTIFHFTFSPDNHVIKKIPVNFAQKKIKKMFGGWPKKIVRENLHFPR